MRAHLTMPLLLISATAAAQYPAPLEVPSDPKAKFMVLEVGEQAGMRTIVTRRIGSSGITYSKRIYDCASKTVKYLGTGDSLAAMAASKPDPKMATIVPGSIADYVGAVACK